MSESYQIDGRPLTKRTREELLVLCRKTHEALVLERAMRAADKDEIGALQEGCKNLQSNTTYMKGERDKHMEIAKDLREALKRPVHIDAPVIHPTPVTAYARLGRLAWFLSTMGYIAGTIAIAQTVHLYTVGAITWP